MTNDWRYVWILNFKPEGTQKSFRVCRTNAAHMKDDELNMMCVMTWQKYLIEYVNKGLEKSAFRNTLIITGVEQWTAFIVEEL